MRLLSFVRNGETGFGVEKDKGIVNLTIIWMEFGQLKER